MFLTDYFGRMRDLAKLDLGEYPLAKAVDALIAIDDFAAHRLPARVHTEAARRYLESAREPDGADAIAALGGALSTAPGRSLLGGGNGT